MIELSNKDLGDNISDRVRTALTGVMINMNYQLLKATGLDKATVERDRIVFNEWGVHIDVRVEPSSTYVNDLLDTIREDVEGIVWAV